MKFYKKSLYFLRGLDKIYKINLGIGVPALISLLVIGLGNTITDALNLGGGYGIDPLDIGESWFLWFLVIFFVMYFEWVLFSINTASQEEIDNIKKNISAAKEDLLSPHIHPWRRYFARMVDLVIIGNIASVIFAVLLNIFISQYSDLISNFSAEEKTIYYLLLLSFIYVPIEALFLSISGTTLGKFIFGISVLSKNRIKIGFANALERTLSVWIKGLALGIPGISFFTILYSYSKLKDNGITSWDKDNNTVVLHKVWGFWRYFFSTISVIFSLIILVAIRDMTR